MNIQQQVHTSSSAACDISCVQAAYTQTDRQTDRQTERCRVNVQQQVHTSSSAACDISCVQAAYTQTDRQTDRQRGVEWSYSSRSTRHLQQLVTFLVYKQLTRDALEPLSAETPNTIRAECTEGFLTTTQHADIHQTWTSIQYHILYSSSDSTFI